MDERKMLDKRVYGNAFEWMDCVWSTFGPRQRAAVLALHDDRGRRLIEGELRERLRCGPECGHARQWRDDWRLPCAVPGCCDYAGERCFVASVLYVLCEGAWQPVLRGLYWEVTG